GCTVTLAGWEQMSATPPCAPGPVGVATGFTVGSGVLAVPCVLVMEAGPPAVATGGVWAVPDASLHPATARATTRASCTMPTSITACRVVALLAPAAGLRRCARMPPARRHGARGVPTSPVPAFTSSVSSVTTPDPHPV